jgi:perosamine synthetase
MIPTTFYTKPSITNLEVKYVSDAIINGWGASCYAYIDKFENMFRKHLKVKYAIATSSCTGALHMGLSALGIGKGDEVILADTNWIATVAPIVHLGATPIFVDILPTTWCIDPKLVEEAVTKRTKAIIATHIYGNLCDMDKLLKIGEKFNIPVIEDAAEAIGSIYHGKRAGAMGKFGTFSFHGSKTITTGEGGMFVTNSLDLYDKVKTLSNHGRSSSQTKQFWPEYIGFKYKLSNIQAAIGCAQVERINLLVRRKREILNFYKKSFKDLPFVSLNYESKGLINGSWIPTIVFDSKINFNLEQLKNRFKQYNIDARVFFPPLSSLNMFSAIKSNFNSYSISTRALNLPSYHDISNEQLTTIVNIVKDELKNQRKI